MEEEAKAVAKAVAIVAKAVAIVATAVAIVATAVATVATVAAVELDIPTSPVADGIFHFPVVALLQFLAKCPQTLAYRTHGFTAPTISFDKEASETNGAVTMMALFR